MEEWLYHLLIKMRKKYHQALENGEILGVRSSVHLNEPWYMRNIAQAFISENQAAKIEEQAETFERTTREFNNKNIQTDEEFLNPVVTPSTQRSARTAGNLPTDPNNPTAYVTAPESQIAEVHQKNELDSDLDASSIPMDFSSSSVRSLTAELMETCIEEIAVGRAPLDLEDLNRRFFPFELFDQFAQTDQPSRQDAEVECELLIEPTTIQTLDQSENTYATQTTEVGTSISVPKMQDVELECEVEQKDKSMMTSGPLNVSRGVSVQSRSSNIQRAIPMQPPNRSQSDNRLTTAAKKRRRFSLSNAIPNFEAPEDRCTIQSTAVGSEKSRTQSSWTSLTQRNEVESFDQSVQMTPSLKRRNVVEVGSQHSTEQQKPSVSHFGVQSSPTLQHRYLADSGAQYSVEETSEFGVQCDPLLNQDVAVQRGVSLDCNDSESSRPTSRTATFQAKEFRSSSTISLQSFELEEPKAIKEKFDLVLQTEDSYLKIARKLDEYRSIRTSQSLHVCATTQDGIESAKRARSARQRTLLSPTSAGGFQFTRKRSSRYKKGERRVSFQQIEDTKIVDQELKNVESNLAPDRPETRADSPAVDPLVVNKERRLDGYETDDESESAPSMAGEIEIQIPSGRQLKRTKANQEVDWQREAEALAQQVATSSTAVVANSRDWSALKPGVQVGIRSETFTTAEILPPTSDVPLKVMVATSSNVRKSSSAQTATISNRALRFAEAGVASSSKTSVTSTRKSSESSALVMATTSPTQSQKPVDFNEKQKRKASLPSLNIPSGIVSGFLKQHDHQSDSNPNTSTEKKVAKKTQMKWLFARK
ncbi:Ion-trans-2 domain-containing protein [Aphelenchoides besseyi]|nr:Ion-trans-2 domain-containing protein [Aphelenchoides besseyi]